MKFSRSNMLYYAPVFVFIGILVLSLSYISVLFFTLSYNEFISRVSTLIHKENWNVFLKQRFSAKEFFITKWIIVCLDIVSFVLCFLILKWWNKTRNYFFFIAEQLYAVFSGKVGVFRQLEFQTKVYIMIFFSFIVLKSLWYNITIPLQYDELWTYNYYVQNSFWQSFLLPGNNHKIYTTIAWWFDLIPCEKQFFIRLPNTIAGVFTICILYSLIKRYFSITTIIIGVTWFATSCPVGIYMTTARSYIYVLFFSVWFLKISLNIIEKRISSLTWFLLFLIVTIGYWGNPVMFFGHVFLMILTIFFLFRDKNFVALKRYVFIHLQAFIVIVVLYLPDILGGHFVDMTAHAHDTVFTDNYFFRNLSCNAFFQIGFLNLFWLYVGLIFSVFILLILRWRFLKNRRLQIITLTGILYLAIWDMIFHQTTAFHIAIYQTLYFTLLIMFLIEYLVAHLSGINQKFLGLLLLIIIMFNSYTMHHNKWFQWSKEQDSNNVIISDLMLKSNISTCYLSYDYIKPAIQFYYKQKGKSIRISMPYKSSNDFAEFDNACKYESIITSKEYPININLSYYKLVFASQDCKCYFLTKK